MNILDFIIVAIVALGGWNGYRTGLFRQITRLFGAVIAYFLSLWLKPYVTPAVETFLKNHQPTPTSGVVGLVLVNVSDAIAFGVVFVITFLILRYAAGLIDTLFQLPVLSTVNRLAGLIAGLILAVVFVYVGALIGHYVNNDRFQAELHSSVIVQWLTAQTIPNGMGH